MKIYINNFNLNIATEIQNLLINQLVHTEKYIQVYTNECVYQVEQKNIFKLEPVDKDIIVYENYFDEFTLIVDPSYFDKKPISNINGIKHFHTVVTKNYYKFDNNSKLKFVIENLENSTNIKNDVYFEIDEDIALDDLFIKKDISEFLFLFK
jgi:hypothetical protein